MGKVANRIKRIEIMSLWSGRKHIVWELKPEVNILSGVNGVGKSTILNKLVHRLNTTGGDFGGGTMLGVKVDFEPSDATYVHFDVIRSFDRPLIPGERMEKLADGRVVTELDWQLYQLQRKYLNYQVNVANRMIEMLTSIESDARERATEVSQAKSLFLDLINQLFSETGKEINRGSNELSFLQAGEELSAYQLSSGEKQMLVILLTVLVQDRQPYVLFMDEPEVSLHIEWQKQLIDLIREVNPNVQIILTTHSPAVIMNGWIDTVTEVSDITD
ncbi:MAG: AAA family ATPase [Bacteroidaceae bacterium]